MILLMLHKLHTVCMSVCMYIHTYIFAEEEGRGGERRGEGEIFLYVPVSCALCRGRWLR